MTTSIDAVYFAKAVDAIDYIALMCFAVLLHNVEF